MSIKIITDSTSDISLEEARKLDIEILPLNIHFGEKTYKDGVEICADEFFNKLVNSDVYPKTSQVNVEEFTDCFQKHINNNDKVIGIFLSSDLSGTFQSAKIAKDIISSEDVAIIDSRTVSIALKSIVLKAVELKNNELDFNSICEKIEEIKHKAVLLAILEDLTYLKKGGRLSGAATVVGNILSLKPIITSVDGKIIVTEKCRGTKAAYTKLVSLAVDKGIFNGDCICVGHGFSEDKFIYVKNELQSKDNSVKIIDSRLGPTVGLYAGPNCTGIGFIQK